MGFNVAPDLGHRFFAQASLVIVIKTSLHFLLQSGRPSSFHDTDGGRIALCFVPASRVRKRKKQKQTCIQVQV